ncbi:hypothetical protein V1478_017876 [Vespula squamosa]|uniref:Uncharacterized protein n=1 Tax=Vespula squamosa TaxID=30214 RepID=A0ABD1ZVG3_VESSQ
MMTPKKSITVGLLRSSFERLRQMYCEKLFVSVSEQNQLGKTTSYDGLKSVARESFNSNVVVTSNSLRSWSRDSTAKGNVKTRNAFAKERDKKKKKTKIKR